MMNLLFTVSASSERAQIIRCAFDVPSPESGSQLIGNVSPLVEAPAAVGIRKPIIQPPDAKGGHHAPGGRYQRAGRQYILFSIFS
jgi:hypothetical protein